MEKRKTLMADMKNRKKERRRKKEGETGICRKKKKENIINALSILIKDEKHCASLR